MNGKDAFDNLDGLMVQPTETILDDNRGRSPIMEKAPSDPYVRVPLRLVNGMGKEFSGAHWVVFLNLLYYQTVFHRGYPISATTKATGCTRSETRRKALRRLERLGFIEIDWKLSKAAPVIEFTRKVYVK